MKPWLSNLLASLLVIPSMASATHGLSADLNHGLGYTYFAEHLWGGISVNGSKRRFVDKQLVLHPRAYLNYQVYRIDRMSFFTGLSYKDDLGLNNAALVDKHRIFALTTGLSATVIESLKISVWLNLWAIRDDLFYDADNGVKHFDTAKNQQSFGDFGGLLLTYLF